MSNIDAIHAADAVPDDVRVGDIMPTRVTSLAGEALRIVARLTESQLATIVFAHLGAPRRLAQTTGDAR